MSLYKGRSEVLPLVFKTSDAQLAMDVLIEIQKGNIPGHSLVHKFGRNIAVSTGWEHVSLTPFDPGDFLTIPDNVRVKVGGNAADTAAGAGAQAVTVQGIVATTFFEESESIELAGASVSAATTKSFWRIHRAYITPGRAGAYTGANTAAIVIETDAGAPVDLLTIAAGEGQSQYAGFTIPAGKTGYLLSATITVQTGKEVSMRMLTRANIDNVATPFDPKRLKLHFDGLVGVLQFKARSPGGGIAAKSDVWWECKGTAGAEQVSVDFELLLVDD